MSPKFETWESYLYPPPGDTVLRNKFDERDRTALQFIEYGAVADRQYEVMTGKVEIPRTYDSDHLRAIHRHLFQDVYDWAGDYRTINMSNPSSPGPFAHTSRIGNYLADAQRVIGGTDWHSLDRDGFAVAASSVFAYLNTGMGEVIPGRLIRRMPLVAGGMGMGRSRRGDDRSRVLGVTARGSECARRSSPAIPGRASRA